MNTYIIRMNNKYYAIGMDLFCNTVYSLENGTSVENVRSVHDRNHAILTAAMPHSWEDAYKIARSCGHYMGQLFPY